MFLRELINKLTVADEQLEKVLVNRLTFQPQFKFKFDFISIISNDLKFLYMSEMGARYLGLKPIDMVGKKWNELTVDLPFKDFERLDEKIIEVFNTGSVIYDNYVGISNIQGQYHYFEYFISPIFTPRGDIEAVMCNVTDITHRKSSEITLSNEIAQFNQLIELCPLGIVSYDNKSNVITLNKAHRERISNFKKEEFLGKPGRYLLEALGLDWESSPCNQALKGIETLDYYLKTTYGTCYLLNAIPLRDCENTIIGAMTITHDITEYEKIKEGMAKLDRLNLIGEMAAGVAHEIRNPMTVIKGYLQFLSKKVSGSMVEQFGIVLSELERIEQIITDFLSLAKNKRVENKEQDLNALIKEMIPLISTDAMQRGIELKVNLAEELPCLLLNGKEIKQLLLNLARNGIESMSQHGALMIESMVEGDTVSLCVADCGCGICKEDQEKIFDPFFTTKESGTGLGLSICAGIARRNNGIIEIESEKSKGTRFIITFNAVGVRPKVV